MNYHYIHLQQQNMNIKYNYGNVDMNINNIINIYDMHIFIIVQLHF